MKNLIPSLALLSIIVSCSVPQEEKLPNIIYILADDLGYGDVGCFGQTNFETPNIDRLAAEGMRFTQHYSGSTVCAPSRSALMTGQHTGHTPIRGNKSSPPEGQWPISSETFTLAELLKQKGYATGAFGKWGLGGPGTEGDPVYQGFDKFINLYIMPLTEEQNHLIYLTGSIVSLLKDIFVEVADKNKIEIKDIIKSPIEGLI